MLFTTAVFFCAFLPLTLLGFFVLGRVRPALAAAWLFAASVFFYGWWMPAFTLLLLGSIVFNFTVGVAIGKARLASRRFGPWKAASALLALGIGVDLGLLCYFKYANFFVDNANAALHTQWHLLPIILPIGISFYSFTQIAFLVDTWAGKVAEVRATHYGLFVTYFPHLIAGPVLHHAQMMPQFEQRAVYRFDAANFSAGLAIFTLGLLKKVVLADGIAPYADAVFAGADGGALPTLLEAWLGALAYTFQLYFDFSGYSDMAIGLSWMFNIRLPFNFNSPYKATSISDFWRRWHISLSTFLRDYLYIALGGNRHGAVLRYINLAVTMILGGLWHGASWSFVIWGTLHGVYLVLNHGWRALRTRLLGERASAPPSKVGAVAGWALTLLAVVVAWVLFRAQTLPGAGRVLQAMAGASVGASSSAAIDPLLWNAGLKPAIGLAWCALLGLIAFGLPNNNRVGEALRIRLQRSASARTAVGAAALCLALVLVLINTTRDSVSAFIYFNF